MAPCEFIESRLYVRLEGPMVGVPAASCRAVRAGNMLRSSYGNASDNVERVANDRDQKEERRRDNEV